MISEIIAFYKERHSTKLSPYYFTIRYWVATLLMIGLGGYLVHLYTISGTILTPILATNIGATAPLIFGKTTKQYPEISS